MGGCDCEGNGMRIATCRTTKAAAYWRGPCSVRCIVAALLLSCLASTLAFTSHPRTFSSAPTKQLISKRVSLFSLQDASQQRAANISSSDNKEIFEMGSQIDHAAQRWNDGEPLFDMKLIQRTIEDWKRPLPESYFDEPLVLVGPSGVGKGRLVRALLGDYSKFFRKIITHTTRRPRPTELDGVNYHFVTADMFREMVSSDSFLEWASVHDNYYGTSKSAWQENRLQKKISIMEIDVQGANSIRRLAPAMGIRPKFLFVKPPDTGMLRERLERRGAESAEEIALRLRNAEAELQAVDSADYFDAIIVNDDIEEASRALFRLMRDWYPALPSAARLRMLQRKMRRIKKMNQEGESDKAPVGHGNISAEVREIPQINSSSDSDAPKLS